MRLVDLTGHRFGQIVVLKRVPGRTTRWAVRCDCGVEKTVSSSNLRSGAVISCGCHRRAVLNAARRGKARHHDLTGKRFGRWQVIRYVGRRGTGAVWMCYCDCGNEKEVLAKSLVAGLSKSCGCLCVDLARKQSGYAAQTDVFNGYRHNSAKRRGLAWGISRDQFNSLTSKPCHYCGAPPSNLMKAKYGNGEFAYNGLDRKDSSEGYVINNVVPCCKICQRAKMDMPYGKFLEYLQRVSSFCGSKNH